MSSAVDEVTNQLAKTKVDAGKELSFKGKGLKLNSAADAAEIAEEISKCPEMTALRMEGNTLGVDAAEAIAKALAKHPEFERALWSDMFTGRLKTEIPQALKHLGAGIMAAKARLVELDLSDNAFGPNGIVGLVDLLKSSSCYTLRELRLNNNGLGITGGKMLAECLLECHKSSMASGRPLALQVFVSGRNRLENEGAKALSEAFKAIGTLEEVAMPQNGINHPGISALADAMMANKQLRVINLNDNTFTERGAKAIAAALPHLQRLEVINFGDCLMRTEGAKAIAAAIADGHKNLRELNLSGNEITRPGGVAIVESLEDKDRLERVDLNCNMLGEDGVEVIKGLIESLDKVDALASLSDDEGTEEEGEGDDYEDGEVDQSADDSTAREVTDGDEVNDPELQIKGVAISSPKTVTVQEFLAFPSSSRLLQLGHNRGSAIRKELGAQASDPEVVVDTVMKVAAVVNASSSDHKVLDAACSCADELLEGLLKASESNAGLIANAVLVHLGLMKSEDKKFRPMADITGALLVLSRVVKQQYFPKTAREMLLTFISKPHDKWSQAGQARHTLLQALYSF